MTKFILASLIFVFSSVPVLAQFSLGGQIKVIDIISSNIKIGVVSSLSANLNSTFSVKGSLTPYFYYSTDLLQSGLLTISGIGEAMVFADVSPQASFNAGFIPLIGVKLNFAINEQVSLTHEVDLQATIPFTGGNVSPNVITNTELNYSPTDAFGIAGGVDLIYTPDFDWDVYLGASYNLDPNIGFSSTLVTGTSFSALIFGLTISTPLQPTASQNEEKRFSPRLDFFR